MKLSSMNVHLALIRSFCQLVSACVGFRKNFFEYLLRFATLSHMKNYRRHSGDGSVKVVLSGDSNSPPKTTSGREPQPCNSSFTQELRTFIPSVAADARRLRRLAYPANGLHDLTLVRKPDQTYSSTQLEFFS